MNPGETPKNNSGEPTAGYSTLPIWMVLACGILFFWGQYYVSGHAAGFDDRVYAPFHDWDEVVANNPTSPEEEFRKLGKAKFEQTCAVCHQTTGLGKEGLAPPLAGSEWALSGNGNRPAHVDLYGLTGPITVKGNQWSATMTPFGDNLTDEQIAAVLTYIRSSWGNNAPAVKPEVVKAARAEKHTGPMGGEAELNSVSAQ